jgi:hypothetical protein
MKLTDSMALRLNHSTKQKLKKEAKQNNTTLSKHVLNHIDRISIQLVKGETNTPLAEKTGDILEQALRLLTKIQSVELAKPKADTRSAEKRAFDYAEAILMWAEKQVEGKPINATLRAIKQAKNNQQIKG